MHKLARKIALSPRNLDSITYKDELEKFFSFETQSKRDTNCFISLPQLSLEIFNTNAPKFILQKVQLLQPNISNTT